MSSKKASAYVNFNEKAEVTRAPELRQEADIHLPEQFGTLKETSEGIVAFTNGLSRKLAF